MVCFSIKSEFFMQLLGKCIKYGSFIAIFKLKELIISLIKRVSCQNKQVAS